MHTIHWLLLSAKTWRRHKKGGWGERKGDTREAQGPHEEEEAPTISKGKTARKGKPGLKVKASKKTAVPPAADPIKSQKKLQTDGQL